MTIKVEQQSFESAILFSLFKFGKDAFSEIRKTINFSSEFFSNPIKRKVFEIIEEVYKKDGNVLSYSGAYKYICGLPEATTEDRLVTKEVFKEINFAHIKKEDIIPYAKQIREFYIKRKFLKEIESLPQKFSDTPIPEVLDDLMKFSDKLSKMVNPISEDNVMKFKGDLDKRIEYVREVDENPEKAKLIKTGFKNFDKFNPMLDIGSLYLIQGRTNIGKSMFMMGCACRNFEDKKKTIVITIEMNARQWAFRIDSRISGILHEEFTTGRLNKDKLLIDLWKERVKKFGGEENEMLLYWVPSECTPEVVDVIIGTNPFKPDLVVVDYAGDMKSGIKGLSDYDEKAQAEIYSKLKQIAGKHNCVIASGIQTKRLAGKRTTTEDGARTQIAADKSDILVAIEQTKDDEDFIKENIEYEEDDLSAVPDLEDPNAPVAKRKISLMAKGRLTARIIKIRNAKKLKTHLIPRFEKMNWIEEELSEPLYDGAHTEENKPIINKTLLEGRGDRQSKKGEIIKKDKILDDMI